MDVIQGKSETLSPCDEAPAIGALVYEKPWLEVACDIWNLDWGLGLVGKVLPGGKKIVKIVNQVANPSQLLLRQPICRGADGEAESRTWST